MQLTAVRVQKPNRGAPSSASSTAPCVGIEAEAEIEARKRLLRHIGYKL